MPLPPAQPRHQIHTRRITFQAYRRDDGLWDIEAELHDSKTHPLELPYERVWQAGEPIHGIQLRVTIDTQMVVRDIAASMNDVPHGNCQQALPPLHHMVGSTLGPGWRKAIERHLGGVQGCAHVRELLFNVATAAFQALPGGLSGTASANQPPMHLGQCVTWDFNGPLVQKLYPVYFQHPSNNDKAAVKTAASSGNSAAAP